LTFTYDAGTGVNELQVLLKDKVKKDLVNLASGATKYTVYFIAHSHETKLNFLGRQNNGFSFLTNISVVHVIHKDDSDE
jgi:hypothetical protein